MFRLLTGCAVALLPCILQAQVVPAELELRVELLTPQVDPGEEVRVRIVVRNRSQRAIEVPSLDSLLEVVEPGREPILHGPVSVQIENAPLDGWTGSRRETPGAPVPSVSLVRLEPGELRVLGDTTLGERAFADGRLLTGHYHLHPGSTVRARIRYANDQAAIDGRPAWVGSAVSDAFTIQVNEWQLEGVALAGTFRPERREYAFGEPMYVVMEVMNVGTVPVEFPVGGDYRATGRPDRYVFTATNEADDPVPDPVQTAARGGGGIGGYHRIGPGEVFRDRLLLNQWCRFEAPGTYQVTGRRTFHLRPAGDDVRLLPEALLDEGAVEDTFEIVLRRDDAVALEAYAGLEAAGDYRTLGWLWHPSLPARFVNLLAEPLTDAQTGSLLRALGRTGRDAHVSGLIAVFERADLRHEGVWTAMSDVSQGHLTEVVPWVRRLLSSASPALERLAIDTLASMGAAARLVSLDVTGFLQHDDPQVRRAAMMALAWRGEDADVVRRALTETAQGDPDANLRRDAWRELARMGDPAGVRAVIALLPNLEPSDRALAYQALETGTGLVVERTIPVWTAWLDRTGGRVAPDDLLVSALGSLEASDPQARRQAARRLGALGPPAQSAIPALRTLLADSYLWERLEVASALAALGDEAGPSLDALMPLLAEPRYEGPGVARAAADAAARFGRSAEPRLRTALASENAHLRRIAVEALGLTGARQDDSLTAIGNALDDPDANVRLHAAVALGLVGPRAAPYAPAVAARLMSASTAERAVLLDVLARTGNGAVHEAVTTLLTDGSPVVRERAAAALEALERR